MAYLFYLPSLLCGLAIGVKGARHRRVPCLWVLIASLAQLVANIIAAALSNSFFAVLQSVLFTLLSLGVMALLALVRPGGIGAEEVKAMAPIGLAVGMNGLSAIIVWWLLMLLFGAAFAACWRRLAPRQGTPFSNEAPFTPIIVVAAVLAVITVTIW